MPKRKAKKKARKPSRAKGRKRAAGGKLPKDAVTLIVLLRARQERPEADAPASRTDARTETHAG
jgi:hypothetical protein